MDTESSEVRDQVDQARARLGDTVEALAYRINAPARARDRIARSVGRGRERATGARAAAVGGAAVTATVAGAAGAHRVWERSGRPDVVRTAVVVKPALRGTMRARKAKKEGRDVRVQHLLGYVAVAIFLTWLTKALEEMIDRWGESDD